MHDIIPNEKRSIRDIPIKKSKTTSRHSAPQPDSGYDFEDEVEVVKKHSLFFYVSAIVVPLLVVAVGFGLYSFKWSGAEVRVVPKTKAITVDIAATTALAGGEVISKTVVATTTVTSSGEEKISTKASGQIIVYNNYSTTPQKLIANTRFASPSGKIYRISKAVSVPGKVGSRAGSITVTVYADEVGESYNSDLTDFTLPGLKGDVRYSKVYGRSKTPIQGGFLGTRPKVSDDEKNTKVAAVTDSVVKGIINTMASSSETIVIKGSETVESHEIARVSNGATSALITQSITVQTAVFPRQKLSDFILERTNLGNESKEGAYIRDFDNLTIVSGSGDSLRITGSATTTWFYNAEKLAQDLAGLPKTDVGKVLSKYTGIMSAESLVRPFWKQTFPGNPDNIHITEVQGS